MLFQRCDLSQAWDQVCCFPALETNDIKNGVILDELLIIIPTKNLPCDPSDHLEKPQAPEIPNSLFPTTSGPENHTSRKKSHKVMVDTTLRLFDLLKILDTRARSPNEEFVLGFGPERPGDSCEWSLGLWTSPNPRMSKQDIKINQSLLDCSEWTQLREGQLLLAVTATVSIRVTAPKSKWMRLWGASVHVLQDLNAPRCVYELALSSSSLTFLVWSVFAAVISGTSENSIEKLLGSDLMLHGAVDIFWKHLWIHKHHKRQTGDLFTFGTYHQIWFFALHTKRNSGNH